MDVWNHIKNSPGGRRSFSLFKIRPAMNACYWRKWIAGGNGRARVHSATWYRSWLSCHGPYWWMAVSRPADQRDDRLLCIDVAKFNIMFTPLSQMRPHSESVHGAFSLFHWTLSSSFILTTFIMIGSGVEDLPVINCSFRWVSVDQVFSYAYSILVCVHLINYFKGKNIRLPKFVHVYFNYSSDDEMEWEETGLWG